MIIDNRNELHELGKNAVTALAQVWGSAIQAEITMIMIIIGK
jgi:hypothetical protein